MPSPMCAIAVADPAYQSALKDAGFSVSQTVEYEGKTYTHDDIAAITDEAYQRHRPDFAIVCGGKPRMQRKRTRQIDKAVRQDVYGQFKISWYTVAFAALEGLLAGPLGLVIAVVGAILAFYIEKDLAGNVQMLMAMGAA